MLDCHDQAPIHFAASGNNAAAVRQLLETAPELAFAPDRYGAPPLELALRSHAGTSVEAVETAHCLVLAAPPVQPTLSTLNEYEPTWSDLYADLVARLPLTQEEWQLIPSPGPGLAHALPAVLQRSAVEAGWLVGRLVEEQRARLRSAALSLARAQQGQRPISADVSRRILAVCLLDS
ncbi:hypothetical protein CHLNCDRAFT_138267 [Chlorella variabilis]|uniref:Uncharacterized protein n=1 Tax=Chlorella variabilis TaxID=554065 RepID=E1ZMN7_CHLVA|nr:hypothetical protein CHLNCDRAFT_138267 [Chlorella variabilis]EFN52727.1 hypothetical protein CHLNCDRAFT_138267 [Chlorella variabilis]|eukprot:XP_005844829.1 hypothetical protein CHLNCDRAFT_138267 [Chlorella variabilis]